MAKIDIKLSSIITNTDDWDRMVWSDLSEASSSIDEYSKPLSYSETIVDLKELSQDLFSSLYKVEPKISDQPQTHTEAFKGILGSEEFIDLKRSTVLDDIGSAIAWNRLMPTLRDQLQHIYKEREKNKKDPNFPLDSSEMQGLRAVMRKAAEDAGEEVEDCAAIGKHFGTDAAEFKAKPFQERWEIANKLLQTKKVRRVAEVLGRFQNQIETAKTKKWNPGFSELLDIVPTQDLNRLLPQEYLKLQTNPALFMKDLSEQNLLGYRLASPTPEVKGPMVACIDSSSSMSGERNEWAVALAMALLFVAQKQKRDFRVIFFNTECEVLDFPRNQSTTLEQKLSLLSYEANGGTNFEAPIIQALSYIQEQPKADIVFITDGEGGKITPATLKEIDDLKDQSLKFISILIDSDSKSLDEITSTKLLLEHGDLKAIGPMDEIFSKLVS